MMGHKQSNRTHSPANCTQKKSTFGCFCGGQGIEWAKQGGERQTAGEQQRAHLH